jgi:hypothetical protein
MSRPVRFCGICGARVAANSALVNAPIAYCHAHADTVTLDQPPPDPLVSLPMQADDIRVEDLTPLAGTEPC